MKQQERVGSSPVQWDEIDRGIAKVLKLFIDNGYETFTSCQGESFNNYEEPHAFMHPTIAMNFDGDFYEFRDKLAEFLISHGIGMFIISHQNAYARGGDLGWDACHVQFNVSALREWNNEH